MHLRRRLGLERQRGRWRRVTNALWAGCAAWLTLQALCGCSRLGDAALNTDAASAEMPASSPKTTGSVRTTGSAGGDSAQLMHGFIVDTGPPPPVDPRGHYYVEFRSRWLAVYGHTYVVYGRLNAKGEPADQHFVALYPRDGDIGLITGSLPLAVPATTLPLAEDADYAALNVYRRSITPAQYQKIQQFVYETRSHDVTWNLYTTNCNHFAGKIAELVGLKVPPVGAQAAPLYVKELELLNG